MVPKIICLSVCLITVLILNSVDGQICSKRIETTREVNEPYWKTYEEKYRTTCWYGSCTKTRRRNRLEYRTITVPSVKYVRDCCAGYFKVNYYYESRLVCEPACTPPCENGSCTNPGTCTCDEGYAPDSNFAYKCNPICEEDCENGSCVRPNTCECNFGYQKQNETCVPICTKPCFNGSCVAPETCECHPGFRMSDPNICKPYCSGGCINGECVQPEVCTCNSGYEKDVSGICVPHCNLCKNGTCIAPDTCVCSVGYDLINNTCQPNCTHPCENGTCIAPNTCRCNPGYTKSERDICEPQCSKGCKNGTCTEPDVCKCNNGYTKSKSDICEPHCSKDCTNGTCTEPEVCTCDPGFEARDDGDCVPFCKQCSNGTCIAPNICNCNTGYMKSESDKCEPHCSKGCENGICIKPEVCDCKPGYEYKEGNCRPNCNKCNNGTCVAPDTCVCNTGYEKFCEPDCPKCVNGSCIYSYNLETKCTIDCRNICQNTNSLCINNKCLCYPKMFYNGTYYYPHYNYSKWSYNGALEREYVEDTCKPVCQNCEGTCVEPNKCDCGYFVETKHFAADDGPCDCFQNCSEESRLCVRTTCTIPDIISPITDSNNNKAKETLKPIVLPDDDEFGLSEEYYGFGLPSNFSFSHTNETQIDTYYFTNTTVADDEDSNEINRADKQHKEKESHPIWIYAVASVSTVLLIILLTLIIKRKSLLRLFSGSYSIQ